MLFTILFLILFPEPKFAYIPIWNPYQRFYPGPPMMNQVPGPPMMSQVPGPSMMSQMPGPPMMGPVPSRPMMYPVYYQPMPQQIQQQSPFNIQSPYLRMQNTNPSAPLPLLSTPPLTAPPQTVPASTSPSNPFLSIFEALAVILQKEAAKSNSARTLENPPKSREDEISPSFPITESEGGDYEDDRIVLKNNNFANLINSLPVPDVVIHLNQHMVKRMRRIKPSQLNSTSDKKPTQIIPPSTEIKKNEEYDDNTLIGLLRSGRWKTMDWRRKLLDEVPTAAEGNALAQLLEATEKEVETHKEKNLIT